MCYVNNQTKLWSKTAFLMNCEFLWIGFEDLDWIGFEFRQVDLIWNLFEAKTDLIDSKN